MSLHTNTDTLKLNNGLTIPQVALGTYESVEGDAKKAVEFALQNGYRHIDTAAFYHNEKEVGAGIRSSGVPREEIFLTTKLWNDDHKRVAEAFNESLDRLGLDYVDCYMIHWPKSLDPKTGKPYDDWNYVDTYKELQKLLKTGKVKSLGVSNFTQKKIETLLSDPEVTVKPVVNQIEGHPLLPQHDLTKWLIEQDIVVENFCPLGSSRSTLVTNETIVEIANKNNVDPGQVLISWSVQRGTVPLPKSVSEKRLIGNLKTFTLSDEDFETIQKLSEVQGTRRTVEDEVFSD